MLAPVPSLASLYISNPIPRLHTDSNNAEPATGWSALLLGPQAAAAHPDPLPTESMVSKSITALAPNRMAARAVLAAMVQSARANSQHGPTDWTAMIESGLYGSATQRGAQASLRSFRDIVKGSLEGPPSAALKALARKLAFNVEDMRRVFHKSARPFAPKSTIGKARPLKSLKPRAQKPCPEEPLTSDPESDSGESGSEIDELGLAQLGPLCPQDPRPGAAWPCVPEAFELPLAFDAGAAVLPRAFAPAAFAPKAEDPESALLAPLSLRSSGFEVFGAAMRARGSAAFFGDLPAPSNLERAQTLSAFKARARDPERLLPGPQPMSAELPALFRTSDGVLDFEPVDAAALELTPFWSSWLDKRHL